MTEAHKKGKRVNLQQICVYLDNLGREPGRKTSSIGRLRRLFFAEGRTSQIEEQVRAVTPIRLQSPGPHAVQAFLYFITLIKKNAFRHMLLKMTLCKGFFMYMGHFLHNVHGFWTFFKKQIFHQ